MGKKSAKEQVEILVEYFAKNIHQIKTPTFNEAQTRQLLIDPFFEALGWDVRNKSMEPPYRLEVITEGRVKSIVSQPARSTYTNKSRHDEDIQYIIEDEFKADHKLASKKPDYRFRIQGQTKFFVEAKKPYVDLSTNLDAIFQIKRYGFSARVPISILTDFDQFRVFDCTRKPFYDKPKTAVLKEFDLTYDSYLDKFDNLYDTFSRDAILAGSLEILQKKYFEKRTGEFSLDRAFLDDLSQWRVELAQDIAKHPKNRRILNNHLLNECVQRILDRIVFLRVCEDRTIEETGTLLALLRLWQDHPAISLFHKFNELIKNRRSLYNGLLFAEHECEQLEIGNKVLENIFKNINYPLSPYNFDEIGVEILGSIYERFLGRTIRMTEKQVRIEEKPEVRKAGGVYYTPQYIVKYIVENTLGKLLYGASTQSQQKEVGTSLSMTNNKEKRHPEQSAFGGASKGEGKKLKLSSKQIEKIKIIDIACGSGSFLLGALQMLFDYHVQWYTEHPADIKEKHGVRDAYIDANGLIQLSSRKKREILVNNIYGVDIDPQAVEVTQMSLYLKVLEDENDATLNKPTMLALHEVLLPPLKNNIKCGNSLIGTDIFSQGDLFDNELMRKINPFDWETEFPEIFAPSHSQGEGRGGVGSPSTNSREGPVRRSPESIRDEGGFDVVIGNPPYLTIGGKEDSFINALEKSYLLSHYICNEYKPNLFAFFIEKGFKILRSSGVLSMILPRTFIDNFYFSKLRTYLQSRSKIETLTKLDYEVFEGATTGGSAIPVFKKVDVRGKVKTLVVFKPDDLKFDPINVIEQKDIIFGENKAFTFHSPTIMILVEKIRNKGKNLEQFCSVNNGVNTGNAASILLSDKSKSKKYRKILEGKDVHRYFITWGGNWINYDPEVKKKIKLKDLETRQSRIDFALRDPRIFDEPKIVIRQTSDKLIGCYESEHYVSRHSTHCIVKEKGAMSLKYILALFNSKLMNFYYQKLIPEKRKAFAEVKTIYVGKLPIRTIDFTNPDEKSAAGGHDELVGLVERMLELNKQLQKIQSDTERETVKRLITATDNKIDQLVYKLYGLTEEEIKVVERV